MKGKFLCAWISLCVLCALILPSAAAVRFEESVGQVHAIDESGAMRIGSCTVVNSERLITCYHCVGAAKYVVCTIKGISFFATVVAPDNTSDTAYLIPRRTTAVNAPVISPDYQPKEGDSLVAYGFPVGNEAQRVQRLEVVDSGRSRKQNGVLVIARPPLPVGMSGGGVFTQNGELVGILQFNLVPRRPGQEPDKYTNTCGLVLLDERGELRR